MLAAFTIIYQLVNLKGTDPALEYFHLSKRKQNWNIKIRKKIFLNLLDITISG